MMGQYLQGNPDQVAIQKPQQVQIISIMTLISGVINIIFSISATIGLVLATFGLALFCVPVVILPGILGIFEILYATNLMANPPKPIKPSTTIAIMEICCILALQVIGPVVGILALVYYNDPMVKDYFNRINSPQTY